MKGQIANFSPQHGQGVIRGEDGQNYIFNAQHWQNPTSPAAGAIVEFGLDIQGHAVNVQPTMSNAYMSNQSQVAQPLPPLPNPTLNPYQAPTQMGDMTTHQGANPVWAIEENYGFMDWVKKCLRNYANFKGRARRSEYWFFYLFTIIANMVFSFIDGLIGAEGILSGLISLALAIPTLAVSARRLHDIHKSGWWQLIALVPFMIVIGLLVAMFLGGGGWSTAGIGLILAIILLMAVSIMLIVWYATDTKPETNQWGLPARRV